MALKLQFNLTAIAANTNNIASGVARISFSLVTCFTVLIKKYHVFYDYR
jgi:hypothetical protein